MSEIETSAPDKANEPAVIGLLGDFDSPARLLDAATDVRDAGYRYVEAYTPFPIHGLEKVLRIPPTPLPWIVLCAGIGGGVAALVGQWWTNAVDYPFIISGKPLFSLPANIPVTFEVIILLSAFATFFGMLALNRLPKLANPLFTKRRFRRATSHRFLLFIDARDPHFELEAARKLLKEAGADAVEVCTEEPAEPARLPRPLVLGGAIACCLALLPPLLIARARERTAPVPRLHLFKDMDAQPKFKAQRASALFSDGRAMRPNLPGTVARGDLREDVRFYRGINPPPDGGPVPAPEDIAAEPAEPAEEGAEDAPSVDWVTTVPITVTAERMERGRQQYNIYCATCHGYAGDGDGLVSLRALSLEQGTWVPPPSLHAEHIRTQPVGQLMHTISHGVRKMPGYAAQIAVEDRWAIVLYVRALQRSQNAQLADVPEPLRETLRDLN